jgi:hypothetical protein
MGFSACGVRTDAKSQQAGRSQIENGEWRCRGDLGYRPILDFGVVEHAIVHSLEPVADDGFGDRGRDIMGDVDEPKRVSRT